jgi:hypothetical protein
VVKIAPSATEKVLPAFVRVLTSEDTQAAGYAINFIFNYGPKAKSQVVRRRMVAALLDCLTAVRKKHPGRFLWLQRLICQRLPEFGDDAQVAVRVLKESVRKGAPFAYEAKLTWKILRPNDKITDKLSIDEVQEQSDETNDMLDSLGL